MSAGRIAMVFAAVALVGSGCGGGAKNKGQPLEAAHGTVRQAAFGQRAVRVRGLSPMDVAGAAVLAAYPGDDIQPNGLVLPRLDRWQEVLLAAQFAAPPVSAAVLPRRRDYLPTATADLVDRLNLRGFPKASGVQAVVLGQATDEVFGAIQQKGFKLTQLKARTPARLSFDIVPFRGGWAAAYSDQIVVVSSEQRDQALPGAAWSAYSGDTLVYAGRSSIPADTRAVLVQRKKLRLDSPLRAGDPDRRADRGRHRDRPRPLPRREQRVRLGPARRSGELLLRQPARLGQRRGRLRLCGRGPSGAVAADTP